MKSYIYQTCIQHFWDAYPDHILPKFEFKDRTETSEHDSKQSQKPKPKVQPHTTETGSMTHETGSMTSEVLHQHRLHQLHWLFDFEGRIASRRGVMLVEKNNLGSCTEVF